MKPRYAAALALAGWIWVVQMGSSGSATGGAFGSKKQCQKALAGEMQAMIRINQENPWLVGRIRGECIVPTGPADPRLKPK